MKATVIHGPRDVPFDDLPDPTLLRSTDAILRISAACVCGSDLWPHRRIQPIPRPTPMGHEFCGIVEDVGSAVTTIRRGQFVIGSFAASDNTCLSCRHGYHSSCVQREWVSGFSTARPVASPPQGLAFAPDGKSFVTSVGDRQSTLWVHAGTTTRQVTFEGFAYLPSFSPDGTRLYYLQRSKADRRFVSGELWTIDLQTGTPARLLPDRLMEHYEVSRDGTRIAFVALDDSGRSSVWEARLDGSAPPRQLSSYRAIRVVYGTDGDLYFVGGETTSLHLYRLSLTGGGVRKVIDAPANFLYDVSPDGKWVAAWVGSAVAFYPTAGGSRLLVCQACGTAGEENRGVTPSLVRWSRDGHYMYFHDTRTHKTYVVTLKPGEVVPTLPQEGVGTIEAAARLLGGQPIADDRAFIGDEPSVYAFPRVSTHRNIYRVTVPHD